MKEKLWLIGAGPMAVEYARVLNKLDVSFLTIGRSINNAASFKEKTGCEAIPGGLLHFLTLKTPIPNYAIVATGVESLAETSMALIRAGVKNILCEKPGGLNRLEIDKLSKYSKKEKTNVLLAYNRRFYSSVEKAIEIIQQDGGVSSFHFEFTEWSHVIGPLAKARGIKENWFLANSTHVADLAFFLGGKPKEIKCYTLGSLDWHPSASVFSGAGISESGALFSYQANWDAPGRWAVEIITRNHRLYFKPMEKLQVQKKGSVQLEFVEIDDKLDIEFKPGLYRQTKAFLAGNKNKFMDIQGQSAYMKFYNKMANYRF